MVFLAPAAVFFIIGAAGLVNEVRPTAAKRVESKASLESGFDQIA
jgi:hypothetical protein